MKKTNKKHGCKKYQQICHFTLSMWYKFIVNQTHPRAGLFPLLLSQMCQQVSWMFFGFWSWFFFLLVVCCCLFVCFPWTPLLCQSISSDSTARLFQNRIPITRTSVSRELPLPRGWAARTKEISLVAGWALSKDCKIRHEVLEVGYKYLGIFSQVGYAGTVIPVAEKTPAFWSMQEVSWHSLHLKEKVKSAALENIN